MYEKIHTGTVNHLYTQDSTETFIFKDDLTCFSFKSVAIWLTM